MYFKCINLVSMKQKTNKKINNVFGVQTKQNFWKTFLCSIQAALVEFYIYLNSRKKIKQSTNFFVFSQEIIYIKWFTTCTCILPPNILGFRNFFIYRYFNFVSFE